MIVFTHIRYKNFLSTGNVFTEFPLNRKTSTLIIGSNGSGKSTILDAITFALFGKPYRNINKPQLVNSINNKDCVVEIEFTIGNKHYKVVRGIKPAIFEIHVDGELLNQENSKDYQQYFEETILKANYKSFTQIVILGAASFIPFMQLTPADRRAVVEDLLDIQVFSDMNSMVKAKVSGFKSDLEGNKIRIEAIKEKIELHRRHLAEIQRRNSEDRAAIEESIAKEEAHYKTVTDKIIDFAADEVELQELEKVVSKQAALIKKGADFVAKLNYENQIITGKIDNKFSDKNCGTCGQVITEETVNKHKEECEKVLAANKVKLDKANAELERLNGVYTKDKEKLEALKVKLQELPVLRYSARTSATTIANLRNQLEKKQVDDEGSVKEESQKLVDELALRITERKQLTEDKQYYDVIAEMLKDSGIKAKVVRQYIPIINKYVNKYLSDMNFYVNFEMDDTFKEVIKSRHRDVFSYENFSEGEKMRIDLALLFTWRAISKMKNSINTNILLFDEVFDSSLDSNGTDEFLKLLTSFDDGVSSFIISHKGDALLDKFRHVVKFEKIKNFSEIINI